MSEYFFNRPNEEPQGIDFIPEEETLESIREQELKQDAAEEAVQITRSDEDDKERKYDFHTIRSAKAFEEAKEEGNIVVLPETNQLLIDIDSPEAEAVYNKNKPKFDMHVAGIISEERRPSRNGNTHIYVTLDRDIDERERILYQLFLGSDQTRELLSYIRVINDDKNPTLFIEKKPVLLLGDARSKGVRITKELGQETQETPEELSGRVAKEQSRTTNFTPNKMQGSKSWYKV